MHKTRNLLLLILCKFAQVRKTLNIIRGLKQQLFNLQRFEKEKLLWTTINIMGKFFFFYTILWVSLKNMQTESYNHGQGN
jgi:hypothetical protein